jgi:ABC-type antimicrobial peptide transport system permease subunit
MNSIKIILRHFGKQKLNSALHIIGLTLGMSTCLLIGLFLRYELSFDNYHKQSERIYRINSVWDNGGNVNRWYSTPIPLAEALRKESTGVEHVTMIHPMSSTVIEVSPDKKFNQENIFVADAEFPDVFDVSVLRGDFRKTLSQPYQAAITQSLAKKYFGDENPIGKTFLFRNEFSITVTSLIDDMPFNSHINASLFLSYVPSEKFIGQGIDGWSWVSGTSVYVVAPESGNLQTLETQLKNFAVKYIDSEPGLPKGFKNGFELQPLSNIHFDAQYGGGFSGPAVDTRWLWFFGMIGLAVLALACINFINLSTAQAITRAKEIGIRKSVGAGRLTLITQFLKETLILCALAGIVSIAVVQLSLPFINTLLKKGIVFDILSSTSLLVTLIAGIVLVSFLAGVYPAWVITRFNPALALKSLITTGGGSGILRKALVVTQFTISVGLLIALILISQQVNYVLNQNLGFEKDNIINVSMPRGKGNRQVFMNELNQLGAVKESAFSTSTPSDNGHWGTQMSLTDRDDPNRQSVTMIMGDENFPKLYNLKLLAGRFSIASDTNYVSSSLPEDKQLMKVVVNETLVKALGFENNEAAIGKKFWCGMSTGNTEIVGVMADFNTGPLHEAVPPVFLLQFPGSYNQAGIKIESMSDLPASIAQIKKAWEAAFPDGIFEFTFLDQKINDFYKSETKLYSMFKIFAGIAMLISCLGLWGLATFAAQQRVKEIGIRKVLGASVQTIVSLLSKEFLLMIAIALLIASPVAYYFMKDWLQTFAYHVDITVTVFLLAGIATALIALGTVGFQAMKAALANPIDSLKND